MIEHFGTAVKHRSRLYLWYQTIPSYTYVGKEEVAGLYLPEILKRNRAKHMARKF